MNDDFPVTSRYRGLPVRTHRRPDGTEDRFVGRRIIPARERFRALDRYRTDGRERIDSIAASAFGEPLLYWRICDANGDAEPADATQPTGRLLLIPLPLEVADDGDA